ETAGNTGLTLIVMLSYSGKWDIVQAAARYAEDACAAARRGEAPQPLDETLFSSYLCTAGVPDPDLLIRTSGEQRISNYMLWQTAYTEFYFTDVLWPDFRKSDFAAALEAFSQRDRRYGKIK
ncbi:MAG: di-trans,poly-cis-decaprenylcistransferase, partial [Bacteroidales bacterium]|nr:di-trans,poly-cis-decaprenylcistransferase [Bacteroidales bacterium]